MPSDSEVPRRPSAIPPKPPHRPGNAGGKSEPGEPSSRRDRFIAGAIARLGLVVMLLAGLHYYIGARMIEGSGLRGSESAVAWLSLWLLLASVPLGFLSWRFFPSWVARPIRAVSHVWIGLFGLVLTSVVATDLIRLLASAFRLGVDRA